jgi:hypothetical protein
MGDPHNINPPVQSDAVDMCITLRHVYGPNGEPSSPPPSWPQIADVRHKTAHKTAHGTKIVAGIANDGRYFGAIEKPNGATFQLNLDGSVTHAANSSAPNEPLPAALECAPQL